MNRGSCCALFQILPLTHPSLVKMMPIDYYTPSIAGPNCNFTRFPLLFFFFVNMSVGCLQNSSSLSQVIQRESWIPVIKRIIKNAM